MNSWAAVKCVLGTFQIAFAAAVDSSVEYRSANVIVKYYWCWTQELCSYPTGSGQHPELKSDHTSVHVTGTHVSR